MAGKGQLIVIFRECESKKKRMGDLGGENFAQLWLEE